MNAVDDDVVDDSEVLQEPENRVPSPHHKIGAKKQLDWSSDLILSSEPVEEIPVFSLKAMFRFEAKFCLEAMTSRLPDSFGDIFGDPAG